MSPSSRREWIEILIVALKSVFFGSPSSRREWIEILIGKFMKVGLSVSLLAEGVD